MKRFFPILILLSSSFTSQAGEHANISEALKAHCGEAQEVFLEDKLAYTAKNITLAHLQIYNETEPCADKVKQADLERLYGAVKAAAASTLSSSPAAFEVMVRFELTKSSPAKFQMQVKDAPETTYPLLNKFKASLGGIKEFHSLTDVAYVVIHYVVAPNGTSSPAK